MRLGKIVKSNTHTDYICQIYNPGEVETPPSSDDYAFGTFIRAGLGSDRWLVGIIYDTVLFNPDFGRLGPRLSPESELAVFSPDYLREKAVLVGILAVGMIDLSGVVIQGVPPLAVSSDTIVERLTDEQVRAFHLDGSSLRLAYASLLLAHNSPLVIHLLQTVVDRLMTLFPDQNELLSVLQDDFAWKAQIVPFGGVK